MLWQKGIHGKQEEVQKQVGSQQSKTGRFTTIKKAREQKDTHVVETIRKRKK